MPGVTVEMGPEWARFQDSLGRMPEWMPAIVRTHLATLAPELEDRMREAIADNRYTGALEESINHEFQDGGYELHIHPTAKRGAYDAGTLLELGVPHPVRVPWAPIKAWAEFRGLPPFPIWYKIRTQGIDAHPFLDRTRDAGLPQIDEAARRIVAEAAEVLASGQGRSSVR